MATLKIGELLIREGLITPSQLDQALTAQQVFGGRLGTNLVEQGFVSEEDLAKVLSQQLGIRMVLPGEIATLDPGLLAMIPDHVARKYQVVPFAWDEARDRLFLAIADPGNLQKVDEIQFALSVKVEFAICPEVMLAWALEQHYGIERQRRYIRVAGLSEAELKLDPRDRPAPQGRAPAAARTGRPAPAEMLRRILEARTKKELITATVEVLAGTCGETVFFVVRGEHIVGWDARGLPASADALRAATLKIADSPLATAALEGCRHQALPRIDDPALGAVLASVFVDCARPAFLLPLIVNRKGFGLCVMSDLPPDFQAGEPVLLEFMKRVACKLQIFFLTEYLAAPL